MKRTLLLAVLAITFLGLSACCGSQPVTMEWQPLPTFRQHTTVPTQTVTIPMQPAYSVPATYAAPCAPAVRAAPCP